MSIEQKIASLIEESKVLQDEQVEEITEEEIDLDEEQLDELSKKTLGSYIKKATDSYGGDSRSIGSLSTKAADKYNSGGEDEGGEEESKSYKRSKGIARAVNRLTKEEIEEGKWNYPSEYTKKPDAEQREREDVFGSTQKADRKEFRKVAKAKAHKALMAGKLTKEEFESEEEMRIDVSEDIAALVNGEDLSEEFKTKATTIFEAAVVTRVKQEVAKLEEEFDVRLDEQVEQIKEGLIEKVDGYLNYIVEQWMEQNELALESGIKSEIVENFIGKLKDVFVESYIDVPEDKYDVIGAMEEAIQALEVKLDETVEYAVEMSTELGLMKRATIVEESAKGLADTDVEKFKSLAEELSFEDAETFSVKLQTIRENYFGKKTTSGIQPVVTDSAVQITEDKVYSSTMSAYLKQLDNAK